MSAEKPGSAIASWFSLSLDVWAVIAAFLAAGFVRAGILKHIPW